MAIWRYLLKPALPWIGRLLVFAVVSLAVLYVAGTLFIRRAEPETGLGLPDGVAGRMIEAGGHAVHVVEDGVGEVPVILVHGLASSTFDWEEAVLPALAGSHRVIAMDLLGMGFSERPEGADYGFDLWTRQVIDVMDALGIGRATLVGHSLGGAITSIVAGEAPSRVERLVLVAPLVPLEPSELPWFFRLLEIPGIGEMMMGTTSHLPREDGFSEEYVERARTAFLRRGTRDALLDYMRGGRDVPRLIAAYRGIQAPALVVAATADEIVPYAALRRWAPAIHDALVLPLDGASHWVMRDQPGRVAEAIGTLIRPEPRT